jgi:hypothetical protein
MEEGDILDIGDLGVEEQNNQNKGVKKMIIRINKNI